MSEIQIFLAIFVLFVVGVLAHSAGLKQGKRDALDRIYLDPLNYEFPKCPECENQLVAFQGFTLVPSLFERKTGRCSGCGSVFVVRDVSKWQVLVYSKYESQNILSNE